MEVVMDFDNGNVVTDGVKISLGNDGGVFPKMTGEVREVNVSTQGEHIFNANEKFNILGFGVSLAIRYNSHSIKSICIIFDDIEFFDQSLSESKIIKKFEREYGLDIEYSHPTFGRVGNFHWGEVCFLYDPRQGDLSLCFSYKNGRNSA